MRRLAIFLGVCGIVALIGDPAPAQRKKSAAENKVANWERGVGAIFDKHDRDKDGLWSPKEARYGFNDMNGVIRKMRAVNVQLESYYARMPIIVGGTSNGAINIDQMKNPQIGFKPPENPYAKKKGDSPGFAPTAAPDKDSDDIPKAAFVQYWVSAINHLDAYNMHVNKKIQERKKSNEQAKNAGVRRR